ncbi:hypothetical protein [Microbacterium sp. P03]|uniref:hypothetical protein n=1 Tax=Microbacterium sp. P03 TaxID=3366946 RepID=UPI00374587A7
MAIDDSCGGGAFTADTLRRVGRQLSEASHRLGLVAHSSAHLAAATDWQTTAARRFHDAVAVWRAEGAALVGGVDDTAGRVEWAQLRASLRDGGWC